MPPIRVHPLQLHGLLGATYPVPERGIALSRFRLPISMATLLLLSLACVLSPSGQPTPDAAAPLPAGATAPPPAPTPILADTTAVELTPVDLVWVLNPVDRTVLGIDPESNDAAAIIPLTGQPVQLVVGEDNVWVLIRQEGQADAILQIDPRVREVTASIPLTQGTVESLAAGAGGVWAGIAAAPSTAAGSGVARIDPLNQQVAVYLPTGAVAAELLVYDQALWALEQAAVFTYIDRIDPLSKQITSIPASVDSRDYVQQFAGIALHASGLWAISQDQQSHYIYRVDPGSGRVTGIYSVGETASDHPTGLLAGPDSLWIALHSGGV
ncbi:MAG: hypothetical protein VB089_20135, partial [Anaerolineaceae bacterium]|nr:hypothetical protein [Anaerolineaceae bacterium]